MGARTPARLHRLAPAAGDRDAHAIALAGDAGIHQYLGAAPPEGHGVHHYYFVVHAVDVPTLGIPRSATPTFLGFTLFSHTLARATITPVFER